MTPTLPTIHSNGTGKQMLLTGYEKAHQAVCDAIKVGCDIEFNSRDYYTQGPDAWKKAYDERMAQLQKLEDVRAYLGAHLTHIFDAK